MKRHRRLPPVRQREDRYKNMLTNRRMLKPDMEKITVVKQV